jgi:hypothetical protein
MWLWRTGLGVAACGFALAAFHAGAGASVSRSGRQHVPAIHHERHGNQETSTNWSGYAIDGTNGSVTGVKGSWIVPAVACASGENSYSSFWVGIDGFNSNTVEQIGTDSDCENGQPVYYIWYEFYPHPSYTVNNIAVRPNDIISAEVAYAGTKGGQFTVTLTNVTTNKTFSTTTKASSAKLSSAEWIVEAPWSAGILPLANFGTASFGANHTNVAGTCTYKNAAGVSSPIGPFSKANVVEMTMTTSSGVVKAQPADLSKDGTSFTEAWVSTGP